MCINIPFEKRTANRLKKTVLFYGLCRQKGMFVDGKVFWCVYAYDCWSKQAN